MTGNYETYDIVLHFSLADQELVREFEHHIVRLFKKPGVTTYYDVMETYDPYYYLDWPYYHYDYYYRVNLKIEVGVSTLAFLFISPDLIAFPPMRRPFWPFSIEELNQIWKDRGVLVIPILLRPVSGLDKLSALQYLPRNGLPITSWNNRDAAFQEVLAEICQIIKQFTSETSALRNVCKPWEEKDSKEGMNPLFLSLAAKPHQTRAKRLLKSRRYEEALNAYEQALIADPTNPDLYIGKGEALLRLKRSNKALEAYDAAIRLDPNQSAAYRGRGRAFDQLAQQTFEEMQQQAQQCREKAKQLGIES